MDTVLQIVRRMDHFEVARRREPVIAFGGGVLTDIVGLATSLYRRSTPYVRVPTTLIGLVDAGIGAKTGVNFDRHKNRLGSYHPSSSTLLDPRFLQTLDERHISNGLAEVLKIALAKDAELFRLLAGHGKSLVAGRLQPIGDDDVPDIVLRRAVQGMLEELQQNLWEHQLQRIVDYGHSFSPTIEMHALPELLHGEAVAIDMALTTVIACRRGLVAPADRDLILGVMEELWLPIWHPVCTPEVLAQALVDTVRHRDGSQHIPLPIGIGRVCFVNDVTPHEIEAAMAELANRTNPAGSKR
jgi:3-dehydroquinate synthetase